MPGASTNWPISTELWLAIPQIILRSDWNRSLGIVPSRSPDFDEGSSEISITGGNLIKTPGFLSSRPLLYSTRSLRVWIRCSSSVASLRAHRSCSCRPFCESGLGLLDKTWNKRRQNHLSRSCWTFSRWLPSSLSSSSSKANLVTSSCLRCRKMIARAAASITFFSQLPSMTNARYCEGRSTLVKENGLDELSRTYLGRVLKVFASYGTESIRGVSWPEIEERPQRQDQLPDQLARQY